MRILKLSTALPKNEFSTEKLIRSFPCELPEGVKENVWNLGVSKRCFIDHNYSSSLPETVMSEAGIVDLCAEACNDAVRGAGLSMGDVGYLVAAYDACPFLSPGLSQFLVPKLGLNPYIKHVNAQGVASTAFMKTLDLAEHYLALHPDDHVLVCISGVTSYWFHNQIRGLKDLMEVANISSIADPAKRNLELRKWVATIQYFLFGDGAAAAVVASGGEGLSLKGTVEVTNVGKEDYMAGYSRLAVTNDLFRFGFHSHLDRKIPELGAKYTSLALEKLLGRDAERVMKTAKKWVVHTGSEKILTKLSERNGIKPEKLRESHEILKEYGNLAGASLPFILDKVLKNSRFNVGDLILMVGYGWGFSAAASLLEYLE
jgi:3-oxoacyl-[acyl-carrier-protein] synthase-3